MNKKSSTELGIVETYKYDYFFHYSLIYYDELRLFLCRYLSHDQSITSTFVINSETFKGFYENMIREDIMILKCIIMILNWKIK